MHKDKNGKIFASLTEVKNKTGDIFALVDQYGEVTLTSYNKERYVIHKINVNDTIDLESKPEKVEKPKKVSTPQPAKKVEAVVVEKTEVVNQTPIVEQVEEVAKVETVVPEENTMDNVESTDIEMWNRNSDVESEYIAKIVKPLQ